MPTFQSTSEKQSPAAPIFNTGQQCSSSTSIISKADFSTQWSIFFGNNLKCMSLWYVTLLKRAGLWPVWPVRVWRKSYEFSAGTDWVKFNALLSWKCKMWVTFNIWATKAMDLYMMYSGHTSTRAAQSSPTSTITSLLPVPLPLPVYYYQSIRYMHCWTWLM